MLRTFALMTGISNLAHTGMFSVFPLWAVAPGPMGLTEAGFGVVMTPLAVGSLIGSFAADRVERALGRMNAIMLTVVASALMLAIPAIWPEAVPVMVGFAISGFTIVVWNVVTVSLRQRITPPHLLGRMNASYRLLAWGSMPLGALIGGVLAEWVGLRATFLIFAGVELLLLLGRLVVSDADIDEAERATIAGETEPARAKPSRPTTPSRRDETEPVDAPS